VSIAIRPAAGPPRPYRFPGFERMDVGRGLRLFVAPMRGLPLVTITVATDAGAMTDPAGADGTAVLTARALLEGTQRLAAAELAERLEELGAIVATDSDWDTAVMSLTVLRERLDDALGLLSEILRTPAFAVREVERLKAERIAEILQTRAEPRGLADEVLARAVYAADSRYARPARGGERAVERLTREDLERFHAARYRPSATTLVITGDVEARDAVRAASEAFGEWDGGPPARSSLSDGPARRSRALHLADRADAPQSELRLGHVGLPRAHPDYFPVLVMNAVLGGLFSSRINLNLRERHAYTYGAYSAFEWRRCAGPFVASTAVQSDVTAAAVREMLTEIDGMLARPATDDEIALATNYLAGVFPIRYETTEAVASALAAMSIYGLGADYFDTYRDRVRAVRADDVRAAAARHLHPDALQLTVVGDLAAVRAPLEALGFGPTFRYDRDGEPMEDA